MSKYSALFQELEEALDAATTKHRPMASPHEGYAVILEELDELWDHVKADTGNSIDAKKEALQVAAMGLRYVIDLYDKEANEPKPFYNEAIEAFTVSQDDISNGTPYSPIFCPVAIALRKRYPNTHVLVRTTSVRIDDNLYTVGEHLQDYLKRIDTGKTVQPYTFIINHQERTIS